MIKKLHKIGAGVIVSVTLVAGLLVAPVGLIPGSVGTQKAAAAWNINVYEKVRGAAGVYSPDNNAKVGTMYYGQRVHGNTGGHRVQYRAGFGYVTSVYYGGGFYFMRSDALQYIGCY